MNNKIDNLRKDINVLQELQSIVNDIEERNYPHGVWRECKEWAIISDLKEKLAELEKKELEIRFAYCKSREKFVKVAEAFSYNGEEMYFYCQSADPKDGLVAYRRENFLFEEDIKELLKNAKTE